MQQRNYLEIIDKYIMKDDISRHNSNLIYSIPAMNAMIHEKVSEDYWFNKIYGATSKAMHDEGWIYIHNLGILGPYCSGYSAVDIAMKGLNSISKNAIKTNPPKHAHSLLGQCSNFIALISQEIHGACAVNDLTTVVASYWFAENELFGCDVTYDEIKNAWQHFIYEVNIAFRSGNSAFSNITMCPGGPDFALRNDYIAYGGKHLVNETKFTVHGSSFVLNRDYKYSDVPRKYYDDTNRAFIEVFAEGDADNKPFTFPLITVNIHDEFDYDNEVFNYLLDECDKWGGIYLENYTTKPFTDSEDNKFTKLNKYIQPRNPELQKSFCCRFQVGLEDILKINSSVFRSGSGVGGIGVFNINLNRIGYVSQGDWKLYYYLLEEILEKQEDNAMKKREFIQNHLNLYPYWTMYNSSLDSYYNVLSICGGNESLVNMGINNGLLSDEGIIKGNEIATFIRDKISAFIKRDNVPVSCEYAPAESAAPKLAKKDLKFVEWLKNGMTTNDFVIFRDTIQKQYDKGVFFE